MLPEIRYSFPASPETCATPEKQCCTCAACEPYQPAYQEGYRLFAQLRELHRAAQRDLGLAEDFATFLWELENS